MEKINLLAAFRHNRAVHRKRFFLYYYYLSWSNVCQSKPHPSGCCFAADKWQSGLMGLRGIDFVSVSD